MNQFYVDMYGVIYEPEQPLPKYQAVKLIWETVEGQYATQRKYYVRNREFSDVDDMKVDVLEGSYQFVLNFAKEQLQRDFRMLKILGG